MNSSISSESTEVISLLIEKADVFGYVTTDDLIECYPDIHDDSDHLEDVMVALHQQGVDIFDEEDMPEEQGVKAGGQGKLDPVLDKHADLTTVSTSDTVGLYMKEMAQVALLSTQEEVDLAIRIENGIAARQRLLKLNGNATPEQHRELEIAVIDGQLARDHLIKANTRLVVSIAKRYIGRGVPFLDLIQEGNLGLMKAVSKYDYTRGFRFSTYATWWIRQTITRAIADQSRTIRVPVHMADRIRQLYRTSHELEQKLGQAPSIEELAKAMKLPERKVDWMMRVSWLPLSLNSPINEDGEEAELGMFVEDQLSPTPIQSAYSRLLTEKIEEVLDTLPPREARILRLRFGLENGRTYTLEEVGQKFGLTRERIRQIEGKALRRLRHPRRARQLKGYL
jgi:RNA polymerase primary sigma factor